MRLLLAITARWLFWTANRFADAGEYLLNQAERRSVNDHKD
jgi:hypothetical protein